MGKIFICLLLALCCSYGSFGQEEVMVDTVIVEERNAPPGETETTPGESENEKPAILFDSVTAASATAVQVREVPDRQWQELRQDEDFWYAQGAVQPQLSRWQELSRQPWFRNLLVGVVVASCLGLLAWYLVWGPAKLKPAPPETPEDGAEKEENIFTIPYPSAIRQAEEAGDYRAAIRLHYWNTLRALAERGLVRYKLDRTNASYLQDLFGSDHYRPFFRLLRHFEYSWYGRMAVSESAYTQLRHDFSDFQNGLGA